MANARDVYEIRMANVRGAPDEVEHLDALCVGLVADVAGGHLSGADIVLVAKALDDRACELVREAEQVAEDLERWERERAFSHEGGFYDRSPW